MSFLTRFERWDPIDDLSLLRSNMDRLWSRMNTEETPVLADWSPISDVVETKDEITIKSELPGVEEKDIDIQIENGVLSIKGERKADKKTEEKGYQRIERAYGSFLRTFTLPTTVEPEKILAEFNNGLLMVHLPKKASAKPQTIKVEVKKELTKAA